MGGAAGSEQRKNVELNLAVTLPVVTADGSPMVRKELIVALSRLVQSYETACKEVCSTPSSISSWS
jgi:regulator-associated protein of mTOR